MKRYAIVRVDDKCPVEEEEDISTVDRIKMFDCIGKRQCGDCRYGDTKEQLERKIAQVLFIRKVKLYKKVWGGDMGSIEKEDRYKQCLELAKEIVEFLGVE